MGTVIVLLSLSQPGGSVPKAMVMCWEIAVEVEGPAVHCGLVSGCCGRGQAPKHELAECIVSVPSGW